MANRLPKYWVVKNDQSDKMIPVLKELQRLHKNWDASPRNWSFQYIGYDGGNRFDGTNGHNRIDQFENSPTLLTIDQFIELSQEVPGEIKTFKFC